ncbi:MAG: MFS transporter [Chloroflexi bacterium]|nr:MFS transporter [Chloroflexota bacterium]
MNVGTVADRVKGSRINYGWASIGVVFAATGLAIGGGQYAFGVFVTPLEQEFGWSRTQINASLSFSAVSGLLGPLVGRAMDRYGSRPVVMVSLLLMAASFLLRPLVTELWQLYALSVLQFAGFPGATALPAARLAGIWFPRTRGRMTGLTSAGANFGGMILPQLASLLLGLASWRWGYAAIGILSLSIVVAAMFLLRERSAPEERPGSSGPQPQRQGAAMAIPGATAREALRSPSFYAVTIGVLAATFTYQAVLTQIVPHLQSVGLTLGKAASFLSLVAVFAMGGKVLFGYLTEKAPAKFILVLSLSVQSVGLVGLMTLHQTPFLWAIAPVYGIAFGGMGAVMTLLVQDSFGLKHFGVIFGLVNLATIGSSIVGPLMVGIIFDATGSYSAAFIAVICIYAVGCACVLAARPTYRQALTAMRKLA